MSRALRVVWGVLLGVGLIGASPVRAQDVISDRVGATAGQFRVDESGAATYSVPLLTVPGTAGVTPEVALAYSSRPVMALWAEVGP